MLASSPNICGVQYCRLLSALPRYHITKQHFRESMPGIISIRGSIVFAFLAFSMASLERTGNRMIARGGWGGMQPLYMQGYSLCTCIDTPSVHARTKHLYMRLHSLCTCEDTASVLARTTSVHARTQSLFIRGHIIYTSEDTNYVLVRTLPLYLWGHSLCTWDARSTSLAIGTPLETAILSFEYTRLHEYVFQNRRLPKHVTLKEKYRTYIPAPHLYEPCTNTSGWGFLTSVFSFIRVRPPKNIINLEWFPPSFVEINSQ